MSEEENTLRDDIANAIAQTKDPEPTEAPITEEPPVDGRDEKGRFKAKEVMADKVEIETKPVLEEAPQSLPASVKAKWASLDPEVRTYWSQREADIHKKFTSDDGELQMGRKIKEVITPYMALIQSEGGTPETAVRDLLNTAYQLRSAPAAQKAQMVQKIIHQYGVDMSLIQQSETSDPNILALQQKIAHLEQMANPETLYKSFEERSENNKIYSEVKAFASDPANKYYEQVKPLMASIMGSGTVQNMKEAYDAACKAHPTVSSMLEAEKSVSLKAKQAEEIEKKRKAAASITGSPGATVPNSGAPNRSLAEELRANYRALTS